MAERGAGPLATRAVTPPARPVLERLHEALLRSQIGGAHEHRAALGFIVGDAGELGRSAAALNPQPRPFAFLDGLRRLAPAEPDQDGGGVLRRAAALEPEVGPRAASSLPAANQKAVHRWTLSQATRQSLKDAVGSPRVCATAEVAAARARLAAAMMRMLVMGSPKPEPA